MQDQIATYTCCAAIVGQLGGGGQVLAGVGLGSIATGSFNWIFSFLSILTIPKIATAMAQGNTEDACTHTSQVRNLS